MAYLGRGLDRGNYLKLDDISSQFNGSTVSFNLTSGGQAFYPGSSYSILVSLAGVVQEPESAYTIDQNQIIFASAPESSDNYYCIALGVPLNINVPADNTVSNTKLQPNSVTVDKIDPQARGVGIYSGGTAIGTAVTAIDFIGVGNTFTYDSSTATVTVSIQGSSTGAGGTWASNNVGVHTTKSVGINTTGIGDAVTGVGNSFQGIYVSNGMMIMDNTLNGDHYIGTAFNGLMAGPVNIEGVLTIDGNYVVV
jgi:hypothetical protein